PPHPQALPSAPSTTAQVLHSPALPATDPAAKLPATELPATKLPAAELPAARLAALVLPSLEPGSSPARSAARAGSLRQQRPSPCPRAAFRASRPSSGRRP